MLNEVKIKGSHPISSHLSTITVGDQTTCLEISDRNGARVTGDLIVTGDIKGNITDVTFDDVTLDDITCSTITTSGTITSGGNIDAGSNSLTANGGLIVDNITIDGAEIDLSSGDLTIDVPGDFNADIEDDIILDFGDGDELLFKEDGDTFAKLHLPSDIPTLTIYESAGGADYLNIYTTTNGESYIETADAAGQAAHLNLIANGGVVIDSYGSSAIAEASSLPITLTAGSAVIIDKNLAETTASTLTALSIDLDKTGTSTSDNTIYGLNIDVDNATATNGTNTMYGFYCSPTLTHNADAGTTNVFGGKIVATGHTNGTSTSTGLDIQATGADTNVQLKLTANANDYATFHCADTGDLTIATIGDGSTDSDLTLDADGGIVLDPADHSIHLKYGGVTGGKIYTSGALTKLMGSATNHSIEIESSGTGDVVIDTGGGNITLQNGLSTYIPTASSDAVPLSHLPFVLYSQFQDDIAAAKHYLPLKGYFEQVFVGNEPAGMISPFNMKLQKIVMRSSEDISGATFTLSMWAIASGTTHSHHHTIGGRNWTTATGGAADTNAIFDFTGTLGLNSDSTGGSNAIDAGEWIDFQIFAGSDPGISNNAEFWFTLFFIADLSNTI